MATGVVISFDERYGLGFIRSRRFAEDVFVHACAVAGGRLLRRGDRVRFEAQASENGPRAVRVQVRSARTLTTWMGLTVVALVLVTGLTAARLWAGWDWPWAWLAGVNLATLFALGLERRRALLGVAPLADRLEVVLAALGGTPIALLAPPWLRPRTGRTPFPGWLAGIGVVQCASLALLIM